MATTLSSPPPKRTMTWLSNHYIFVPSLIILLNISFAPTPRVAAADSTSTSSSSIPQTQQKSSPKNPNIVILFADNLGYNDIGLFGSPTAKTPNIDRLAYEGMKLNNWNSAAALCSASRAALMTGRYPVRTGVYPGVFKPDAQYGMSLTETTIAEYLKTQNYATSIVGKWHLGHNPEYQPTARGFDEWFGIPYHMSGGSLDHHVCGYDTNRTIWLPLYENTHIVEQPVNLFDLAPRYAQAATNFIHRNVQNDMPFFLYVPFSHVHQLCAPQQSSCQWASHLFSDDSPTATFVDAVEEMDWIAGQVLDALDEAGVAEKTLVLFTSDNGPWVAEKSCSGSKGPFEGRWLQENVAQACTACPKDYIPHPIPGRPRRCVFPGTPYEIDGVHCGADTGLGGCWEANLRMPALARWPNHIPAGAESMSMVSTLDVVPTVLSVVGMDIPSGIDGIDITDLLIGGEQSDFAENDKDDGVKEERTLFFWRDGFQDGPLPAPYGRFDVVAVKHGRIKVWIWTKSGHYNDDVEVYHDPPLLFDVLADPAEATPLDPTDHQETIELILELVEEHKATVDWSSPPLTVGRDVKNLPCADRENGCRTTKRFTDGSSTATEKL